MKRLIFVNRFFAPDHSATSQLLSDLTFVLTKTGRDIHVVTSRQLYDDPKASLLAEDILGGVHVHRVTSTQFGRTALTGRAIDYGSFYASLWRRALSLARRNDILVPMTDPPLVSIPAMRIAKRRGAHLINWLQDIYPEVAIELGIPFLKGPGGNALSYLRDASLKAAKANVVVGERMAERVISRGVTPERVHVIPNWSDDEQISPVCNADNPLRREWSLDDKFVVGYSGNLGRAHEFDTVLACGERLRTNPRIVFVCIGGGYRMDEFVRAAKTRGLESTFRFMPYHDRPLLKYSLCVPDVHWISLNPAVEGLIVPSKFYGIAAAGRPIIAITARDGEIAQLVQQYKCGLIIEPGKADALAAALVRLSTDAPTIAAMGARARAMLDARFTRRHALDNWRSLIDRIEHSADKR
jgi:colanic acid biosynthesis glycosyl transferase WcaI